LPIGYAIYESLLVIKREGTFGAATEVFGGFTQYVLVFQNGPFWQSIGRVLMFGVVQVPIMLGLALLFALLLDSPLLRGKRFFRLAFFVPYAVPGVIAAIMWGYLYSPNLSPFSAVTENVNFLSADLVLWSIANVVTWVYVGYNMLIIYSALLAIPTELYEAAKLDGASDSRLFWYITAPMISPVLLLQTITGIIAALQSMAQPQLITNAGPDLATNFLMWKIYSSAFNDSRFGYAIALVWVLLALIAVLTIGIFKLSNAFVYAEDDS